MTARQKVLYDNHCRLCLESVRWMKRLDTRRRFELVPIDKAGHLCRGDACLDEIRLVRADGSTLHGFHAVAAIASQLPRVAWLGSIASLPVFRTLGQRLYLWIARNRYRLSRSDSGAPTSR